MFEKEKKILENSIKMYDETLKTMKERDAKPENISLVIEMRRQVEEQMKTLENGDAILLSSQYFKHYEPYRCNRFILDFKESGICEFNVNSVYYDENNKNLLVTLRNSVDFFAPEYFEKNRYFEKVELYLLNPVGVNKALIEFDGVQLESVTMDEFNYKSDDILKTYAKFTFKNVTHKTL